MAETRTCPVVSKNSVGNLSLKPWVFSGEKNATRSDGGDTMHSKKLEYSRGDYAQYIEAVRADDRQISASRDRKNTWLPPPMSEMRTRRGG
ncbi:hypothetical protein BDM02DRAFT_811086 [Thelephora ganbajun]|uniref:Uncharacterized protein n=1 Tax=Thelephora ganbajun TaxID=370292 RepID=A0ACB6Z618_THEGA|nr:hypothetical protein BDM02DRAFT_811086 [Thelephora ganbajun]